MAECESDADSFVEEIEADLEADGNTRSCSCDVHVPSLLSRLKRSSPPDLSRKRKLRLMRHIANVVRAMSVELSIHRTTRIRVYQWKPFCGN